MMGFDWFWLPLLIIVLVRAAASSSLSDLLQRLQPIHNINIKELTTDEKINIKIKLNKLFNIIIFKSFIKFFQILFDSFFNKMLSFF